VTILRYFLLTFVKKLIWIHYVAFIAIFLLDNNVRTYLLTLLFLNLFMQQIKILNSFKDLFLMCKLYRVSLYRLALYNFILSLILLIPFYQIIGFYSAFSILFLGLSINTLKVFYYEYC